MVEILKIIFTAAFLLSLSSQVCKNNTDIRYDLKSPVQMTNYYSICSQYTGRTCCSPKNIQSLAKKVKKAIDSAELSARCKQRISKVICSLCDGDWVHGFSMQGQGVYEGVCGTYCYSVYESCSEDYFVIDSMNNKIRACKDTDLFCWKLSDLVLNHYKVDVNKGEQTYKICQHFDIASSQQASPCWSGQVSSAVRGRPKKTIDFNKIKRKKGAAGSSLFAAYEKEIIYGAVVLLLVGAVVYKVLAPKRKPYYYRLDQ